jgi:hypothetical protein
MFAVEIYAAVRRFVFVEGRSRREAARVFGLSRDTISKMCRYSAPPGYVRSKAPERPKLGPLVPVIDAILEADKTAPPKQRHTAKRIFERLRIEHGYAGGYTVVKDYVRIAPKRSYGLCPSCPSRPCDVLPAQLPRAFRKAVLTPPAFVIVQHLVRGRLTNVDEGAARQVIRRDLGHHRSPCSLSPSPP